MKFNKEYFESKEDSYFESLDKRTKEYKEWIEFKASKDNVEEELSKEDVTPSKNKEDEVEGFKNRSKVTQEIYNVIMTFNGRVPAGKIKWLFNSYNTTFGTTLKSCMCAGKIKRMLAKLRVTYERENNYKIMEKKDKRKEKTKFTEEYIKQLFQECIEWLEPKEVKKKDSEGNTYTVDIHKENVYVNQFFNRKGLSRRYMSELLIQFPYLKEELDDVLEVQEAKLVTLGLFKKTESGLTKFVLINRHNKYWEDKKVRENTHEVRDFNIKDLVKFKEDNNE